MIPLLPPHLIVVVHVVVFWVIPLCCQAGGGSTNSTVVTTNYTSANMTLLTAAVFSNVTPAEESSRKKAVSNITHTTPGFLPKPCSKSFGQKRSKSRKGGFSLSKQGSGSRHNGTQGEYNLTQQMKQISLESPAGELVAGKHHRRNKTEDNNKTGHHSLGRKAKARKFQQKHSLAQQGCAPELSDQQKQKQAFYRMAKGGGGLKLETRRQSKRRAEQDKPEASLARAKRQTDTSDAPDHYVWRNLGDVPVTQQRTVTNTFCAPRDATASTAVTVSYKNQTQAAAGGWRGDLPKTMTLAPDTCQTVSLTLTPRSVGETSTELSIRHSNSPSEERVKITGRGVEEESQEAGQGTDLGRLTTNVQERGHVATTQEGGLVLSGANDFIHFNRASLQSESGGKITRQSWNPPLAEDSELKADSSGLMVEIAPGGWRRRNLTTGAVETTRDITSFSNSTTESLPPAGEAGVNSRLRLVDVDCPKIRPYVSGRLEYELGPDVWGTVCDDCFDGNAAQVACRGLGYRYGRVRNAEVAECTSGFDTNCAASEQPIALDDVQCSGNETLLTGCKHSTVNNCDTFENTLLYCANNLSLREQGIGAVRLVPNGCPAEEGRVTGRLEVALGNEQWGTVCDDRFDTADAEVACRDLGYSAEATVVTSGLTSGCTDGISAQPIGLDEVQCSGDETRLRDCEANAPESHDCVHIEDIHLDCQASTEPAEPGAIRLAPNDCLLPAGEVGGRLEVDLGNGHWGTVCDDRFGTIDAEVACGELGYQRSGARAIESGCTDGGASQPIVLDEVGCRGNETRLQDCEALPLGDHNCNHGKDVHLACPLLPGSIRLTPNDCTPPVGGAGGRIEVKLGNGQWGTVCDDNFGRADAEVACRELGYTTKGASYRTTGCTDGDGSQPIALDELQCSGTESRLGDCPARPLGDHNCDHVKDVHLICLRNIHGYSSANSRISLSPEGIFSSSNRVQGGELLPKTDVDWYSPTDQALFFVNDGAFNYWARPDLDTRFTQQDVVFSDLFNDVSLTGQPGTETVFGLSRTTGDIFRAEVENDHLNIEMVPVPAELNNAIMLGVSGDGVLYIGDSQGVTLFDTNTNVTEWVEQGTTDAFQTTVMPTTRKEMGTSTSEATPGATEPDDNGRTGKIVGGVLGGGVGVAGVVGIALGGYKCTKGCKKGQYQPNKPIEMEDKTSSRDNEISDMKTNNTSGDMDEK